MTATMITVFMMMMIMSRIIVVTITIIIIIFIIAMVIIVLSTRIPTAITVISFVQLKWCYIYYGLADLRPSSHSFWFGWSVIMFWFEKVSF